MKLRQFVLLLGSLTVVLMTSQAQSEPITGYAQPNLLFILADDYGVDSSPLYVDGELLGEDTAATPSLARLSQQGVRFTQGFSAPNCTPTRAQFITGQYGFRNNISNVVGPPAGIQELDVQLDHLLPKRLAEVGYASAMIGKWQLNFGANNNQDFSLPIQAGYDFFFGTMGSFPIDRGVPNRDGPEVVPLGEPLGGADYFVPTFAPFGRCDNVDGIDCGRIEQPPADPATEVGEIREGTKGRSGYATTLVVDETLDWIAKQSGPWFINLSLHAPHAPFVLPPRDLVNAADPGLVAAIEAEFGGYPEGALVRSSADPQQNDVKAELTYAAMVAAVDTEVGRLLDRLDLNKTLVVFMGDNGTPASVAKLPFDNLKVKSSYYRLGSHVPFIVAGAGVKLKGKPSPALVNTTDVYATFLDVAGAQRPTEVVIDGVSFRRTLEQPFLAPRGVRETNYTGISQLFGDRNTEFTQVPAGSLGNYEGDMVRTHRFQLILATRYEGVRDTAVNIAFPTRKDGTLGGFSCVEDPQPTEENPSPCSNYERAKVVEFYDLLHDPYQNRNLVENGIGKLNSWQLRAFNQLADELESLLERPGIVRNASP